MDQNALVNAEYEGGKRLIAALPAHGFEVRIAFWAKPTEAGQWYLYLASPFVDEKGPTAAYRLVNDVLRQLPDVWIEWRDVKVVGIEDSITESILPALPPKEYPGMKRFRGS